MSQLQAVDSEHYQEIFEEAPVAFHELDSGGIIRRVNRAECELLGYTQVEMLGHPIWEFVASGERGLSKAAVLRKLSREQPLVPFRRTYFTRGQGRIAVEVHERLILDGAGFAVGIRTALLNVTEQTAAKEALVQSQCWLSGALNALMDAVIAVDPLGAVRFMNSTGERLTGVRQELARGKDIEEVLILRPARTSSGESVLQKLLWSSLVTAASITAMVVRSEGSDLRLRITSSPVLDRQNAVIGAALIIRMVEQPGPE